MSACSSLSLLSQLWNQHNYFDILQALKFLAEHEHPLHIGSEWFRKRQSLIYHRLNRKSMPNNDQKHPKPQMHWILAPDNRAGVVWGAEGWSPKLHNRNGDRPSEMGSIGQHEPWRVAFGFERCQSFVIYLLLFTSIYYLVTSKSLPLPSWGLMMLMQRHQACRLQMAPGFLCVFHVEGRGFFVPRIELEEQTRTRDVAELRKIIEQSN